MAKIYYTEVETAAKLGLPLTELATLVRDGKIRSFQDGARKMYKVEEVDKLASLNEVEVELSPIETISLSEVDIPQPVSKEDTVITAEGISIFDDEELEIEAADPMAKTQIAPTLDEQLSIEGVGSGSGLLDLTRESDDTSLGEVLEHIGDNEVPMGSGLINEAERLPAMSSSYNTPAVAEVSAVMPNFVEEIDPSSGAFNGMIVGGAVVMILSCVVALGLLSGMPGNFPYALHDNLLIALIGSVVVLAIGAIVGFTLGKSAAQRQAALQRMS